MAARAKPLLLRLVGRRAVVRPPGLLLRDVGRLFLPRALDDFDPDDLPRDDLPEPFLAVFVLALLEFAPAAERAALAFVPFRLCWERAALRPPVAVRLAIPHTVSMPTFLGHASYPKIDLEPIGIGR